MAELDPSRYKLVPATKDDIPFLVKGDEYGRLQAWGYGFSKDDFVRKLKQYDQRLEDPTFEIFIAQDSTQTEPVGMAVIKKRYRERNVVIFNQLAKSSKPAALTEATERYTHHALTSLHVWRAHLMCIAIVPALRGKGVGTYMLNELHNRILKTGYAEILTFDTSENNRPIIAAADKKNFSFFLVDSEDSGYKKPHISAIKTIKALR